MTLKSWLEGRGKEVAERWLQELRLGFQGQGTGGNRLMEDMAFHLVSFLPVCFGECRERALEVWHHVAHLYGTLGVKRGLAAGEVVEELQLLRAVILRLYLFDFIPLNSETGSGRSNTHMDFLTLNRILDQGVSQASISYLDDLFFTHLQNSGVSEAIDEGLEEEILRQLESFRDELGC